MINTPPPKKQTNTKMETFTLVTNVINGSHCYRNTCVCVCVRARVRVCVCARACVRVDNPDVELEGLTTQDIGVR